MSRAFVCFLAPIVLLLPQQGISAPPTARKASEQYAVGPKLKVGRHDYPQWGGSSLRNNTSSAKGIPTSWDVKKGVNIKWKAKLGWPNFGTPIVANGRVFVATSAQNNYLKRFRRFDRNAPNTAVLCFEEKTGKFLWQFSSHHRRDFKIPDHNWPESLVTGNPLVDGDRLWLVTSRFEVVCLDVNGFRDGKNNGPYKKEPNTNRDEADVIWKLDMIKQLKVAPHGYCSRAVATDGKRLFVVTGNGVRQRHDRVSNPGAPSFLCLDRDTGKVLWSDNSPGKNILDGQWASPTYFKIGKQAQVLFPGGDGWLYSFDPRGNDKGQARLLWKFDCNPKTSKWVLAAEGTRNFLVSYAVIEKNRVYIAVGRDPDYGEGPGHLYCIDPLKRFDGSDVSPTLAVDKAGKPLMPRRIQCVNKEQGEREIKNPKSAMIWHYTGHDKNGNGDLEFGEAMHRSIGAPVVKDGILYIADFAGVVHCVDAKTGGQHWTYDAFADSWCTPLVVDGKVYVGDSDGDLNIFPHTADPKKALKIDKNGDLIPSIGMVYCENAVRSTPVVANGVLFIATQVRLYAIAKPK